MESWTQGVGRAKCQGERRVRRFERFLANGFKMVVGRPRYRWRRRMDNSRKDEGGELVVSGSFRPILCVRACVRACMRA